MKEATKVIIACGILLVAFLVIVGCISTVVGLGFLAYHIAGLWGVGIYVVSAGIFFTFIQEIAESCGDIIRSIADKRNENNG